MKIVETALSVSTSVETSLSITKNTEISLDLYLGDQPLLVTTTLAPLGFGNGNTQWNNENFVGYGNYINPYRTNIVDSQSVYWASKQITINGYVKLSWDTLSLSSCNYDYLAIGLSNNANNSVFSYYNPTYTWRCTPQTTPVVIPVTSGQYLVLQPDSTATFTNLKIWWSTLSGTSN
jgi:hypothetical protein